MVPTSDCALLTSYDKVGGERWASSLVSENSSRDGPRALRVPYTGDCHPRNLETDLRTPTSSNGTRRDLGSGTPTDVIDLMEGGLSKESVVLTVYF